MQSTTLDRWWPWLRLSPRYSRFTSMWIFRCSVFDRDRQQISSIVRILMKELILIRIGRIALAIIKVDESSWRSWLSSGNFCWFTLFKVLLAQLLLLQAFVSPPLPALFLQLLSPASVHFRDFRRDATHFPSASNDDPGDLHILAWCSRYVGTSKIDQRTRSVSIFQALSYYLLN